MDHHHFMQTALELAQKGRGYTAPNPMVGAVVVQGEQIVGQGYHQAVGGPHAEVNAIDDAGLAAAGATLYVTLEPCHHTGRTPPCTAKILQAGIKRVVMAMADPNPDVQGGGAAFLRQAGVEITSGVEEAGARRLNEVFIKHVTTKRPFVVVKCAATLDGRLATKSGDARWITGEASRAYVHELRHWLDGIMVGINTVKNDNPSLTARLPDKKGRNPLRIILDTHLDISEQARVLHPPDPANTLVVTGSLTTAGQAAKQARIEKKGARVMQTQTAGGRIALKPLMTALGAMDIGGLLIEGGARVIGAVLKEKIADKLAFFYAPKLLGGDDGVPICAGPGAARMQDCIRVRNIRLKRFDDDVLIEGYLDK